MLTLYTPATGFPDLEVKIAYGLARVGIEASGINGVKVIPEKGFYKILVDADMQKLKEVFKLLSSRILSSPYLARQTPGITGRSADKIKTEETDTFDLSIYEEVIERAEHTTSENFCRHVSNLKVSNVIGFTALATTGVLCKRDGIDITYYQKQPRRPTDPREICKTCGLLALLGMWFGCFMFNIADREVIITPIPVEEVSGKKLQEIFALQHIIKKYWFSQKIPETVIPLIFLAKIPSSSEILKGFDLFIAILSRQQGYHVDAISLISLENYLKFFSYSPFNGATIDVMLNKNAFNALIELNRVIYYKDISSISKFARLYVQETSINDYVNLLYPKTAEYLLKEVAMIKLEIIQNPAILSLAKTLRYFVRERNYGYVDSIRNARKDSRDFEETIAKMLREAEIRRVQQEQDRAAGKKIENWVYLPNEKDIQEVFKLATEDFESTKLALVILAFSFPSKSESDEN